MEKNQLAIIHIAKKQTGLSDQNYRELLYGAAGVSSAKEIQSNKQFLSVMQAFEKIGFKPENKKLPVKQIQRNKLCTERQRYYIKGLWELTSRAKSEESLRSMIKRIADVDDLRFLNKEGATKVILALRRMCIDKGINPDCSMEKSNEK